MAESLSAAEESMMERAFEVTMLRAAEITDRITQADVVDAQVALLGQGCSFAQVAKIDRAMLASAHIRSCAMGLANDEARRVAGIIGSLKEKVR
jgi:hypothetical protein